MAGRPVKQTVDYFPHMADAAEGRTLSILFNHFGHEGLSAWWLLLGLLCKSNLQYISIQQDEDYEWLAAKMHFQIDKLKEILKKMASIGAIDKDLFDNGVIWSQNLVDNLQPVYEKRKQEIPIKPCISVTEIGNSDTETPITATENTQRNNRNYIKGDNSRGNKTKGNAAVAAPLSLSSSNNQLDLIAQEIFKATENLQGTPITGNQSMKIRQFVEEYHYEGGEVCPVEWIDLARRRAVDQYKRSLSYMLGILKNWRDDGGPDPPKGKGKPSNMITKPIDPEKYFKGRFGHLVKGKLSQDEPEVNDDS